jgi:hypothetical protein
MHRFDSKAPEEEVKPPVILTRPVYRKP